MPKKHINGADWALIDEGERYKTSVELFSIDGTDFLNIDCQGKGGFAVSQDEIVIDWQQGGTDAAHYFQTLGLALWLERKGVLCIHANALSINGTVKAIALLAPSRTGKTTLSARLAKNGFMLMTDDMMALHESVDTGQGHRIEVYPGWPEMRLWPDSIQASDFSNTPAEKVHQKFSKCKVEVNSSNSEKKELQAIYFLNRIEQGCKEQPFEMNEGRVCEIKSMPKNIGLVQLLQNSILGSAFQPMGLEAQRFKALSKVINSVEIKQVNYRSGFDFLDEVSEQIKADALAGAS